MADIPVRCESCGILNLPTASACAKCSRPISRPRVTSKTCPFCVESIHVDAIVCPFCRKDQPPPKRKGLSTGAKALIWTLFVMVLLKIALLVLQPPTPLDPSVPHALPLSASIFLSPSAIRIRNTAGKNLVITEIEAITGYGDSYHYSASGYAAIAPGDTTTIPLNLLTDRRGRRFPSLTNQPEQITTTGIVDGEVRSLTVTAR
jgi:hypothetical protein